MTEKEFNSSVIAPIQLSLATSKIAVEKAANNSVKEFAGFEMAEAITITSVLKNIGTTIPQMDEEAKDAFTKIESQAAGMEFDKLYMQTQLKNHRYLRDLTEDYLNEAPTAHLDNEESQGKHLATLMLLLFFEHVALTERISKELNSTGNY